MTQANQSSAARIATRAFSQDASGGPVLCWMRQPASADRPGRKIAIRLADNEGERNLASMVINRRYGARGYGSDHRLAEGRSTVTFTASTKTEIFGTITLTVDSDEGLALDKTFPDELAALRADPDTNLCELTKFAFDPSADARPYLASLFHVIYLYGTERYGCTDLLIEVNPRHVRFYETMLGFKRLGGLRTNSNVAAPSQLMHVKVATIGQNIELAAGKFEKAGRSLYPYFFSKKEEAGLRQRIAIFAKDPVMGRIAGERAASASPLFMRHAA